VTDKLHELAEGAGLALRWRDVYGRWHEVGPDTLRTVLGALGLPAMSDAEIADSLASLQHPARLPPMLTADAGGWIKLPPGDFHLVLEDGREYAGAVQDGQMRVPDAPGYHRLSIAGQDTVLAVAPARGWTVADATPGRKPWGLAVQLYALRRTGDGGIGDFGGLAAFVTAAAAHGASAVAISPVHAQFSATPDRFSPYSPSSRTLLNVLHAAIDVPGEAAAALEARPLIDWPAASRRRLDTLAALYAAAPGTPLWTEFEAFRAAAGPALEGHARFEALHAHFASPTGEYWHWRRWPDGLSDASSAAVDAFAQQHAHEVTRHAFYQFLADRSLGQAQAAARAAGMPIGLIADLAVGVDSGGSQCWSRPDETLLGLSIGAPPDLLSPGGQSWGLVAFSPRGLLLNGFSAYIEMLRAAMRHAGGVRIDHAMGLARLWVIPDGASAADGVYLHFPLHDMLRLIRLESARHQAIVLGEDLGTVPDGFQNAIADAGMLGMRVLWFERAQDQGFTAPSSWDRNAVAMTSTHDLATIAGWWTGGDIAWRERAGIVPDGTSDRNDRARDRAMLWSSMQASGAAQGPMPAADDPVPAVDAGVRHVGGAACTFAVLPIEDALGLVEQPNLPGTMDEQHPNWCRRLPGLASALLDEPAVATRLAQYATARNNA
jgi:4-alpha-glucanotransferase